MKAAEIVVLGGCHVLGWPQSKARPFPTLLGELVGARIVRRVPHLRLAHLADALAAVDELGPTHAVFQLGNYEFTGYLKSLVHQCSRRLDTRRVEEKLGHYAGEVHADEAGAGAPGGRRAGRGPAHYARVGAAGALVTGLWLFSRQYRAGFRRLAACARQHPGTSFIFVSPLPCLAPADNTLRRFGGWLLRHRLPALPNVHWLDAHQLLGADQELFVDAAHLNQRAHQALAYGLAATVLGHADGLVLSGNPGRGPDFCGPSLAPLPLDTLPAPPLLPPPGPTLPHRHFVLHKPYGCLSQFRSEFKGERNKQFLGALHDFPPGTMAIGRLDEASEGLLLLTTDGALSAQVRSPGVEKEYYAQVDGLVTDEALTQLQAGFALRAADGTAYHTAPCRARRLAEAPPFAPRTRKIRDERHGPTSWLAIVLTEGKFRQVRKMTAAAGLPTLRLVRVRVGGVWLGDLAPGEAREVAAFAGCGN